MATVATGTTVTFATSSFSAEITSVSWDGITREALQTSAMATTNDHTFTPASLVDNGEVSFDIFFDGDESPPIITNGAAETVTIDWGGSGNTMAASMINTGFSVAASLEELATGTVTLKASGAITYA